MRSEVDEDISSRSSGSDSEGEEQEAPEPEPEIEWLATSRAKRSTAGNRLNALIQQEEDDELELLFEEAEDDGVFEDNGADDGDVQMDSSDDDDDQGPAAGDDLEGEKELQKQAKAEQRKKRKLNDGIPKIYKKKVKIDPTASRAQTQAPRPKKKSERASWIPTPEDAPTRASARGTTKQSKEQLHQQMVEREIKRQKQLESMERAAAKKEAAKKPPMTQEDRLKEAAKVEKSNAKSLSRWEEMEQQREEEQRLRLANLQNRTLEGPVITWWSGMAEWVGDKLKKVGQTLVVDKEVKEKATRKRKAAEMEDSSVSTIVAKAPSIADSQGPATATSPPIVQTPDAKDMIDPQLSAAPTPTPTPIPMQMPIPDLSKAPVERPRHISPLAPPRQPTPPKEPTPEPPRVSSVLAPPPMHGPYPPPPEYGHRPSSVLAPPPMHGPIPPPPNQFSQHHLQGHLQFRPQIQPHFDGSTPLPGFGYNFMSPQHQSLYPGQSSYPGQFQAQTPTPVPPPQIAPRDVTPPPPVVMNTAIEYIILNNFDETAVKDKSIQCQILFDRTFEKMPRMLFLPLPFSLPSLYLSPYSIPYPLCLPNFLLHHANISTAKKKPEVCAITSRLAKYRDPITGLPYHDKLSYDRIQSLKKNEFKWSKLVGAYVGRGDEAARGVPSRFVNGTRVDSGESMATKPSLGDNGRGVNGSIGRGLNVGVGVQQSS